MRNFKFFFFLFIYIYLNFYYSSIFLNVWTMGTCDLFVWDVKLDISRGSHQTKITIINTYGNCNKDKIIMIYLRKFEKEFGKKLK